jgi:hypothetical protein
MIKRRLKVILEQRQRLKIKSAAAKESCELSCEFNYEIICVNAKVDVPSYLNNEQQGDALKWWY